MQREDIYRFNNGEWNQLIKYLKKKNFFFHPALQGSIQDTSLNHSDVGEYFQSSTSLRMCLYPLKDSRLEEEVNNFINKEISKKILMDYPISHVKPNQLVNKIPNANVDSGLADKLSYPAVVADKNDLLENSAQYIAKKVTQFGAELIDDSDKPSWWKRFGTWITSTEVIDLTDSKHYLEHMGLKIKPYNELFYEVTFSRGWEKKRGSNENWTNFISNNVVLDQYYNKSNGHEEAFVRILNTNKSTKI